MSIRMGALGEADRVVVSAAPQWVTATSVLGGASPPRARQGHLALNQAGGARRRNREVTEANFRRQAISTCVTIRYERLRTTLDTGCLKRSGLTRPTRMPIKDLRLPVGNDLV